VRHVDIVVVTSSSLVPPMTRRAHWRSVGLIFCASAGASYGSVAS
jgi:hypothetical protein